MYIKEKLAKLGEVRENVLLKSFTTFKIGGPAWVFFTPYSEDSLVDALSLLKQEGLGYYILGGGSNILISSKGLSGAVIKLKCSNFINAGEEGRFDIDIIATGISHTQHDRMRMLTDIIRRLGSESKDGNALRGDIVREAEIEGLESGKVEEALDRLKRQGHIYEPVHGKYKITEY